ncbi:hypothetical protein M5689_014012 [Euphorbia peplus]|nr:hypothetical protein M5689_014012 [Euphorbia peplus]
MANATSSPASPPPLDSQPEPFPSASTSQLIKLGEDSENKVTNGRINDVEVSVPVVHGTIAFHLGKKATETQSHKWTVYVRGATNEDLGVVIKRVVFHLHPSFTNPTRVVETPPFEISECGWGEFEIAITLYFHSDVCDKQLELFHQLKLYPPEDETYSQSMKRPVVVESYNEIVFPDPSENLLARVLNHPAVIVPRLPVGFHLPIPAPAGNIIDKKRDTKDHSFSRWFLSFSDADELFKLAAARQEVQAHIVNLRRQLSMIDGLPQPPITVSSYGL